MVRVLGVCFLEAVKTVLMSHPEIGSRHHLDLRDVETFWEDSRSLIRARSGGRGSHRVRWRPLLVYGVEFRYMDNPVTAICEAHL